MIGPRAARSRPDNMRTVSMILLSGFLIVALSLFFWGILRAQSLLSRDDNPRLVEAEQRIKRGTIFDRHDVVLALNIGPPEKQERFYPFSYMGPAVGYYSLTYGTTGAENGFNELLRGDDTYPASGYWQQILHQPQIGHDVRLALDSKLQANAHSLLAGRDGAVLLLDRPQDGSNVAWLRVLSSSPGYDPNLIDDRFESLGANEQAPLLNRITQGQYQPGLLLQPLILAMALEQGTVQMSDHVINPQRLVEINGKSSGCISPPPEPSTWSDVLRHQCPGPMQDLADQLGSGGLDAIFAAFELDRDPQLEIETTTTPDEPLSDPLLAGIGQDNLSITPLKIGLAMAALSGDGSVPLPRLALESRAPAGDWQRYNQENDSNSVISGETRNAVQQALPQYGDMWEIKNLVISGPEGSTNAWYVGMMKTETSDQVVVVILEGSSSLLSAQEIGRGVISAAEEMRSDSP